MCSVNCRWSLIEVRSRCSGPGRCAAHTAGPDFSVANSLRLTEAGPRRKQSALSYGRGSPAVTRRRATSLRDCLRQTARIYIGANYTRCIRTRLTKLRTRQAPRTLLLRSCKSHGPCSRALRSYSHQRPRASRSNALLYNVSELTAMKCAFNFSICCTPTGYCYELKTDIKVHLYRTVIYVLLTDFVYTKRTFI